VRVVLEEVVLGRPVVLDANVVAEQRYFELALESAVLVVARRNVHLREDSEFHRDLAFSRRPPRIDSQVSELPFEDMTCQSVRNRIGEKKRGLVQGQCEPKVARASAGHVTTESGRSPPGTRPSRVRRHDAPARSSIESTSCAPPSRYSPSRVSTRPRCRT